MIKKASSVEEYLAHNEEWQEALVKLRTIVKGTSLQETIKWNVPVYTLNNKNVVGLAAFKNYVGLWFYNGVFLKDVQQVLVNAQEGKTKALRQWRFETVEAIDEDLVLSYVQEAIENQKQGKEIKPSRAKKEVVIPEELQVFFNKDASLKEQFETLTAYKKREYCEYISTAKRAETKQKRIEKSIPKIKEGVGLNDKYRNC